MNLAKRRWLMVMAGLGLAAAASQASVPRRFSVQGKLTGYGAGPVDLQVRFYAASAGGAALGGGAGFCDHHPGTALANGVFTIVVGGGVDCTTLLPNGAIPAAALDPAPATTLWMELTVNGTALARERVWAVPFSIASITAESLVAPDSFTQAAVVDAFSNVDFVGDISTPQKVIAGAFASHSPLIFEAPAGSERARITDDGKMGIGETSPLANLHVQGSTNLGITSGDIFSEEDILVEGGRAWLGLHSNNQFSNSDCGINFAKHAAGTGAATDMWSIYRQTIGLSDLKFSYGTSTDPTVHDEIMRLTSNGDVGIGTSDPLARLQVESHSDTCVIPVGLRVKSYYRTGAACLGEISNFLDLKGTQILAVNADDDAYTTLALNPVGGGVAIGSGSVNENETLYVHASNAQVNGDHLNLDDVVIEDAANAWLGLYSDDEGNTASGITFAEINPESLGTDHKWSIYSHTQSASNNAGSLIFAYTTDNNPTAAEEVPLILRQDGTAVVKVLEITGADIAERFPVSGQVEPGMVVEIDPENAGQLRLAGGAYNRRVAGVVSGAGNLPAGAILGNLPGTQGSPPIALSGRVWVYCDASGEAIQPGDLLTTAERPGHAMKVTDYPKAQGAVIGKAMSTLGEGQGLVLVLVNLQ